VGVTVDVGVTVGKGVEERVCDDVAVALGLEVSGCVTTTVGVGCSGALPATARVLAIEERVTAGSTAIGACILEAALEWVPGPPQPVARMRIVEIISEAIRRSFWRAISSIDAKQEKGMESSQMAVD
jgi:hypothetical protein